MTYVPSEKVLHRRAVLAALREAKKAKAIEAAASAKLQKQDELCRRVSMGESLIKICSEDKAMPAYETVLGWLNADPGFAAAYSTAQRHRADVLFEETLTIADDARNDWMVSNAPNNPGWVANGEHLARSKLRVETRKWAASKLNSGRYGDKVAVEGNPDKPIVVAVTHKVVQIVRQEVEQPTIDVTPIDGDQAAMTPDSAERGRVADASRARARRSDWDD